MAIISQTCATCAWKNDHFCVESSPSIDDNGYSSFPPIPETRFCGKHSQLQDARLEILIGTLVDKLQEVLGDTIEDAMTSAMTMLLKPAKAKEPEPAAPATPAKKPTAKTKKA